MIEVTSKASRWFERKSRPIALGEPKPWLSLADWERLPPALSATATTNSAAIAPEATIAAAA